MKKLQIVRTSILFVLMIILTCLACVNETKNSHREGTHPADLPIEEEKTVLEYNPIWEYDYNTDSLIRVDSTSVNLTAEDAIHVMNNLYKDKIRLDFIRQSGDTLFVKIDTATVLTQQMGSAGARAYMALATFTLTEPDDIHLVSFDFEEGDHAYPGMYRRASFEKR